MKKSPLKPSLGYKLFKMIPADLQFFYKICETYASGYRGEDNSDMRTNGEFYLALKTLKNARVAFDVGANRGHWTQMVLSVNPSLNVHCFEPSPSTFSMLMRNHFPPNVRCNNFGLGSAEEEKELFVYSKGNGMNTLYNRGGLKARGIEDPVGREKVVLRTLESYCREKDIGDIDFVKIDTEGHEWEVIQGMGALLKEGKIKSIQFEYGPCFIDARIFLKDIFQYFEDMPYTLYKIYPRKLVRYQEYDQRLDNFQHATWAIIHDSRR